MLRYKNSAFWILVMAIIVCIAGAACSLADPGANPDKEASGQNETQLPQHFPGPVDVWYDIVNYADRETGAFRLEAFPAVTFRWNGGRVEAVAGKETAVIIDTQKLHHIGAVDLNMDGYPEICITAERSVDEHSCYVVVYDHMAETIYTFPSDSNDTGYFLFLRSNYLMCAKESLERDETEEAGRLMLTGTGGNMELTIFVPALPAQSDGNAMLLYDKADPDSPLKARVQLEAFPGVTFCWNHSPGVNDAGERLTAVKNGVETVLFPGGATNSVYIADITGDGKQDICANVYYFFSGMPSYNAVYVYDYANDGYYMLADDPNTGHDTKVSYYVRLDGSNLVCDKIHQVTSQTLATGVLMFSGDQSGRVYLEPQITYDSPVKYIFIGKDFWWDRVTLTVCADGSCDINFNPRLNADGTSNWAQGTHSKTDGKLIVDTEDGKTYTFRFEGDDLRFQADESDALPANCPMYDGAILEANPYFP